MGASEDGFIRYYAGVALADRADGLRYGFREDAIASKKRNRNQGVSVDGDVYLTVLHRSFVRAGTPTTPAKTNTVDRVKALFTLNSRPCFAGR